MEYTFTTDDEQEAMRIIKSRDMASVLWELTHNGMRGREGDSAENLMEYIYRLLAEHNIDTEELIT